MQHLYFSFMQTYRILLSPTSQRLAVHPLSPERGTCCMLFIGETLAFLLSLSVSSSIILSYALTKWYQLSPFTNANGFETIFCLEYLQILNALHMAGGRNNKGLLLWDISPLFQKFTEIPYNWYPGPY